HRHPGTISLASMGSLDPGKSGLIVETTPAAFRAQWNVDASVPIVVNNIDNIGRADELNIYQGTTLADRLTYDDQPLGGVRTQGKSAMPTDCLALGANTASAWVFSAVGDGRGSRASVPKPPSTASDIGSPGSSPLNAC